MKKYLLLITIFILITLKLSSFQLTDEKNTSSPKIPAAFIENKGQWIDNIRYMVRLNNLNVWITNDGIVYDYYKAENNKSQKELGKVDLQKNPVPEEKVTGHIVKTTYQSSIEKNVSSKTPNPPSQVQLWKESYKFVKPEMENSEFVTSNPHKEYLNYFLGKDSKNWTANVQLYDEVVAKNVFPGIDARYYFDKNSKSVSFRYDFIINPGGKVSDIKIHADLGNDSNYGIIVNNSKQIVFNTILGELVHQKPVSYQNKTVESPKSKVESHNFKSPQSTEIKSSFIINDDGTFGFETGDYDTTKPLIIDPLVYSTFLGGNYYDSPNAIVLDASGNAFICGSTYSTDFPRTTGAYSTTKKAYYDCFVSKINSTGTALIYSTFLGGADYDYGTGIALDAAGNAYVTGYTYSSDFPFTKGAFDSTFNGSSDCFVVKLNPTGTSMKYSTYFGGTNYDCATGIAVDTAGCAFITGYSNSTVLPTTSTGYQRYNSGGYDCFLTKFDVNGANILFSTFIGGTKDDYANALAIDLAGNEYITGYTNSTDFPTTGGVYSNSLKAGNDCFVVKLNPDNPSLTYSTYIGGSMDDYSNAIAIDTAKNVYITGYTYSSDFPTSTIAVDNYNSGNYDCFATKLNASGSVLIYSTYLGGSNHDYGTAIAVNINGNAFIAGNTYSSTFPTTTNAYDAGHNGAVDGFLLKLNKTGATLAYSTFFGGVNDDYITAIALENNKNAVFAGSTYSSDLPITSGVFNPFYSAYSDGFVSKISDISSPIITGRPYYYSYCAGYLMSVFYSTDEITPSPNTTFYAQLSDSTGSFNNPTILGSLKGSSSGYIWGVIPANTPLSYKYRVRVVSTNPDAAGNINDYDFAIYNMPPQPKITKSGNNLISNAATGNQWYLNSQIISGATSKTYTPVKSGIYSVAVTLNSCSSIMSDLLTIVLDADKLTAGFSAAPTIGLAPLSVNFKDSTIGTPTSWNWDFGDNQSSTKQNPSHTYTKSGSYNVKLTVSNGPSNDTKTNFSYIIVQDAINLTADFIATPTTGEYPLKVQFSDNSSGAPVGWIWDFGDNKVSTEANPEHIYLKEGKYSVTLKVLKGSTIDSISKSDYITVSIPVDVEETNNCDAKILVLPSPNSGIFTLKIENLMDNSANLKIVDEIGRVIYNDNILITNDEFTQDFNLVNMSSGVYFLKLRLKGREIVKQFNISR